MGTPALQRGGRSLPRRLGTAGGAHRAQHQTGADLKVGATISLRPSRAALPRGLLATAQCQLFFRPELFRIQWVKAIGKWGGAHRCLKKELRLD